MASIPGALVLPLFCLLLFLRGSSFVTTVLNTHLTKDIVKVCQRTGRDYKLYLFCIQELVGDRRTMLADITDLGYIAFDTERRYAIETYTIIKNFRNKDPSDHIVKGLKAMAAEDYRGMFNEAYASGNPLKERNLYLSEYQRIILSIASLLRGWP
ncbi:hypothetical protein H6P81_015857 [Aristolochia fimbriata]|uniref:Pectinesterase inhibitor domain-containing protein n=1 Tax=Aristolochia fimbriata TaxID=158543 RepID=A0AAV7E6R2_ARIFI|nr:hypothetical protein H6P81_015857 [Aristolochia fimbriata]